MKSDVITIDNRGGGFEAALSEAEAAAKFRGLDNRQTLRLRILTEELLGMVRLSAYAAACIARHKFLNFGNAHAVVIAVNGMF